MPRAVLEFKSIFKNIKITPYVFIDENKVLHFKHFSNISFNLNNLLLYNKNYVFPNN